MKKNCILILLICFFTLLFTGFGFTQDEVISVPRNLSLFLVIKGDFTADEILLLEQTLLMRLAEDKDINVVEPIIRKETDFPGRNLEAENLGADCWLSVSVSVSVSVDPGKIEIIYSTYDMIDNKALEGKEDRIEEMKYLRPRELGNLNRVFWQEIISWIASTYSPVSGKLEIVEKVKYQSSDKESVEYTGIKVVIEAYPGTRIYGLKEGPLVVDERGIAVTELPINATYQLRAVCQGYYSVTKEFYVGNEPVKVTLAQDQGTIMGFDIYLHQFDYIGLGYIFYFIPNTAYLELSVTSYLMKLIWPTDQGTSEDWQGPLFPLSLTGGMYFSSEDDLLRIAFNMGLFTRIIYIDGIGLTIDPICPVGIKVLGLHAELSGFRKIRFYYEHNILLYITRYSDMLEAMLVGSSGSGSMSVGYLFRNNGVIDFLDIKLGVRILL